VKPKIIIFVLLAISVPLVWPSSVWAAKARTARGASMTVSSGTTTAGRVASSVKFKANRLGIIVSFSGLNNATSVTYELTYTAAGIPQGARGTVSGTASNTASRELLFGTCSKNVCRWHTNITAARLVVTSRLNSGLTTRKSFRLKV